MATVYDFNMDGGDWTGWTSQYTDGGYLIIEAAAKYAGSYGFRVQTHDSSVNPIYSYCTFTGTKRLRYRFYMNIENLTLTNYNSLTIASAASSSYQVVRTRVYNANGTYQFFVTYRNDVPTEVEGTYFNITKTGWHYYEVDYKSASSAGANDGFLYSWVDGVAKETGLTGLDNDTHTIQYHSYGVRFGYNATDTGYILYDEIKGNDDGTAIGALSAGETLNISIDPNTSFKDGLRVI